MKIVKVDLADPPAGRKTPGGLNDIPGPEGDTPAVKFTLSENPLRLVTTIVELPEAPARRLRDDGLGSIVKSGAAFTFTDRMIECKCEPLTASTVIE